MLGNKTSSIFLGISNGKIVRAFKEPTADSKSRINKMGRAVHEEFYDYVEGKITGIRVKESEYGKFWVVSLKDGGTDYLLEMNYSGGNSGAFLKVLPNIDPTKKICIIPRTDTVNEKKRSSLIIDQNGKALKWFWTKDAPGDMPKLEQKKIKGVTVWDDSEMMEFLEKYASDWVAKHLSAAATNEDAAEHPDQDPPDDLPF
jgi:hypothetical protein